MENLTMPNIRITFKEAGEAAAKKEKKGTVALILKDTVPAINPVIIQKPEEIPEELNEKNKQQIAFALMGNKTAPKIEAYCIETAEEYENALDYFKNTTFQYLAAPEAETDKQTEKIAEWIKTMRKGKKRPKAVLPNTAADDEGVINYTIPHVFYKERSYTAEEYCSRLAGLFAGTPMTEGCTYAALTELDDCERFTEEELNQKVARGELVLFYDGEKVKIGRAVNSFITATEEKKDQFKKIKLVDTMDTIAEELRRLIEDNYLGKMPNTYDNKCLLISAIQNYLKGLGTQVFQDFEVEINIDENKKYLEQHGVNTEGKKEAEIKQANTGSHVFLKATFSLIDAFENFEMPITI